LTHKLCGTRSFALVLPVLAGITTAKAQDAQPQKSPVDVAASAEASLEKAVQNPIASLISVPLQNDRFEED
jgi:hypothetical protein